MVNGGVGVMTRSVSWRQDGVDDGGLYVGAAGLLLDSGQHCSSGREKRFLIVEKKRRRRKASETIAI